MPCKAASGTKKQPAAKVLLVTQTLSSAQEATSGMSIASGEKNDSPTTATRFVTSRAPTSAPILQSWAYKIFISLAVTTVLALHAAYPRPTGTYHQTTDAQTPATSATSSPVPHIPNLPDSP